MKKAFLCFALAALLVLLVVAGASAATVYDEGFETWNNSNVATGWTGGNLGSGGEWNQIYAAGQAISCGGDGTNYKAVYRDMTARNPYFYWARVDVLSNAMNSSGVIDGSVVRMSLQFLDATGGLLATFIDVGDDTNPSTYVTIETSGTAPAGTATARVFLQVMGGKGGGVVFKNFNFYELVSANDPNAVLTVGQNMTRSTEWPGSASVCTGWNKIEHGGGAGDVVIRATGGSAQGVSCSGTTANFRDISREFSASAGFAYQASVEVVSNSMNSTGAIDPSLVVQYLEFLDSAGKVLTTAQSPGNQYNIRPAETATLITNGTSPAGTAKVRVTQRVFGGTGGGTVFDNFKLINY